ncbi:hypothetical protein WJX81_001143 [Elliptochloris bilobata]|uniref:RRM domain-containing protein n=1 Tax=Elliptochloris bilobata TaxID=381761 RepID=A0AAW1RKJ8_9CHLO
MADALAAASAKEVKWVYLDESRQHAGPYDADTLRGLAASGAVTPETLVWAEGQASWLALRDCAELQAPWAAAASGAANDAPAAVASSNGAVEVGEHPNPDPAPPRGRAAAAKAVRAAPAARLDPELAAFRAEISAIDGGAGAPAAEAAPAPDLDAPATPPPNEREFEDDDGTWYAWDPALRKFAPGEGGGLKGNGARQTGAEAVMEKIREKQKRAREASEKEAAWFDLKVNTSVYVQGLPDDVTETEMGQFFSKCGIIKDGDDGRPRIKIYRDRATGMPKGDGLVTYLKEPSVALACNILDGSVFRDDPSKTLSVQVAKFEMRGPEYVPKKKAKKQKKGPKAEKALGWGGFDDQVKATQVTVVLRNVFHPDDFVADPTLRDDLEGDMMSECAKLGAVDKVKVYHHSTDGVVTVKFRSPEAAQSCIRLMSGRFFGGRRLEAELWDGVATWHAPKPAETAEEQAARLEAFARELEEGERSKVADPVPAPAEPM